MSKVELLTVNQTARALGVNVRKAYRMVGSVVPAVKVGEKRGEQERRHWRTGRVDGRWATKDEILKSV